MRTKSHTMLCTILHTWSDNNIIIIVYNTGMKTTAAPKISTNKLMSSLSAALMGT